jgi:hypothetical protein
MEWQITLKCFLYVIPLNIKANYLNVVYLSYLNTSEALKNWSWNALRHILKLFAMMTGLRRLT